jgi:hypothetical protein
MPEADPVTGTWFYAKFGGILQQLGHEVRRVSILANGAPTLLTALAAEHGWPAGKSGWAYAFSHPDAVGNITSILAPLRDFDLVVGFEMPPNLIRALHALDKRIIDVSIDSIRFCDDLFFRMRSNDPTLQAKIASRSVPTALIASAAESLKSGISPLPNQPDAVLFAGQIPDDSSLIAESRIQTATAFADRLATVAAGRQILVKPHPYALGNEDLAALHQAIPGSRFTRANIYALLAAPWVKAVTTLSSSVASEAYFFGKDVTRLIEPDVESIEPATIASFERVDASVASVPFWAGLLEQVPPDGAGAVPISPLRRIFSVSWGYAGAASDTVPPRLERGETTANVEPFCVFGWSGVEPDGIWSDGKLAVIHIPADGAASTLILTLNGFVPDDAHPQTLDIITEPGAVTKREVLTTEASREVRIDILAAPAGTQSEVSIRLDEAVSPAAFGMGPDERRLGVKLRRMQII